MNKISNLLDQKYILNFFREKVLPKYPEFIDIEKIVIKKHKNNIWPTTYHVVFEFVTTFKNKDGSKQTLPIFCSAHSDEPRDKAYDALCYLWDQDFNSSDFTIPRALFYEPQFKAVFYQGLEGVDLHRCIRENSDKKIEPLIVHAAQWFAKLHGLSTKKAPNFNPKNSRIRTVIPGKDYILERIKLKHPQYFDFYKVVYGILISCEEDFLAQNKLWFVHGDAHPGNIIKINNINPNQQKEFYKIGVIDFTDLCLADFARDLGTFFQQVDYMFGYKMNNIALAKSIKKTFLNNYLKCSKIKMTESLEKRIENYYDWTAMRTATFLLLRNNSDKTRVKMLCNGVRERMGLKIKI